MAKSNILYHNITPVQQVILSCSGALLTSVFGQEERTIDYDGEIRITPFNMKEELEEGYFDKDGFYIFQKEDIVKDQWLDDIDWIKVKAREETKTKVDEEEDESDEDKPAIDLVDHYTQMLKLMQPNETVQKAICRLGGGSTASRSNKWKKRKVDETSTKTEDNLKNLRTLTSLANNLVQSGDIDVYRQTYEKMSYYVNMTFSEKNKTSVPGHQSPSPTAETANSDSEVMWEFKWENSDDSKVYGPFPTSQMQQWVDEEYFENGVFVRQVDKPDADFYNSKRMDFELYM